MTTPTLPDVASRYVTGIVGFDTRHKFHVAPVPRASGNAVPSGGYLPNDLRTAYRVPSSATGAGVSVATLQLGPWNPGDLQTFSNEHLGGITPNYTAISVLNGTTSPADMTTDDHLEVALDQETILGQAPQAAQRAYFAPNSDQGDLDALLTMAHDSIIDKIVTASTSWGECEAASSDATAESNAVTALVATGTTFFAASGDTGAYDCAPYATQADPSLATTRAVDLPAAEAGTVGAGGTSLPTTGPPPTESAWSGSGGGQSTLFSRPSYQSGLSVSGSNRLVPDLAADGDPQTGANVYDSQGLPNTSFHGGDIQVGGTSLAAPMMAGAMAATLTSTGCTAGVGDIHSALYKSSNVNDVTTGRNNGAQSSSTGGFPAGPGYDEATGVGSPKWDLLVPEFETGTSCAQVAAVALPEAGVPVLLVILGLTVSAGGVVAYRRRHQVTVTSASAERTAPATS